MNRFDTHNLSYMRRNHGLLWPTASLPIPWIGIARTVLFLIALIGAYGLVDANDRATEARMEAAQASADLLACLNGNLYLIDQDGSAGTKCLVAETVALTTEVTK